MLEGELRGLENPAWRSGRLPRGGDAELSPGGKSMSKLCRRERCSRQKAQCVQRQGNERKHGGIERRREECNERVG